MNETEIAAVCKALGDGSRLMIVRMLSGGELCACELLKRLEITQPTLSHHMKVLCGCALVNARREGKWSHYSLNCETLRRFKQAVEGLTCCRGQDGGCGG